MALTIGTGPLGPTPAGALNFALAPPGRALYLDPVPYRVRALVDGVTVLDSRRAALLHEGTHLPVFYVPRADVRADLLRPSPTRTHCPYKGDATYDTLVIGDRVHADALWAYRAPIPSAAFLDGLVALRFDVAERWLCEDAEIRSHPRDPYHRIDCFASTAHVRVSLEGCLLAESRRAILLAEAALPARWYLPADDLVAERLVASPTRTLCAYKGDADYRSAVLPSGVVPDVAWSYADPAPELAAIAGRVAFFDERVDVDVDGARAPRPVSAWS